MKMKDDILNSWLIGWSIKASKRQQEQTAPHSKWTWEYMEESWAVSVRGGDRTEAFCSHKWRGRNGHSPAVARRRRQIHSDHQTCLQWKLSSVHRLCQTAQTLKKIRMNERKVKKNKQISVLSDFSINCFQRHKQTGFKISATGILSNRKNAWLGLNNYDINRRIFAWEHVLDESLKWNTVSETDSCWVKRSFIT